MLERRLIDLEANAEKIKYMSMYHHQNAGQYRNIMVSN
jgi:hypothetical protein